MRTDARRQYILTTSAAALAPTSIINGLILGDDAPTPLPTDTASQSVAHRAPLTAILSTSRSTNRSLPSITNRTVSNTDVTSHSDVYSVISDQTAVFTTLVNRCPMGYAGASALDVRRISVCIRTTVSTEHRFGTNKSPAIQSIIPLVDKTVMSMQLFTAPRFSTTGSSSHGKGTCSGSGALVSIALSSASVSNTICL